MKFITVFFLLLSVVFAKDEITASAVQKHSNYIWTLIAAFMVFFMQAGFALLESGLSRGKNALNVIMKNLMDMSLGVVCFYTIGFGIMFGKTSTGFFGETGFFLSDYYEAKDPWVLIFWMFQCVFAATAATIISGAIAERTKFSTYLVVSTLMTALIYPVFGSWAWGSLYNGQGWLESLGFIDFAGSTVVHSIGGWAALAGAMVVGARRGKYRDGVAQKIPGHNMVMAALGVFILWFGWYGFNAGSTTEASGDIALITVNTTLAAAGGSIAAFLVSMFYERIANVEMVLNGVLAGLVSITAGCANVSPLSALVIGFVGGVIVYKSCGFVENVLKIDDPVSAVSVHGVCGAFGTIAAGLFNQGGTSFALVGVQVLGVLAAFLWSFPLTYIMFKTLKNTMGLRVESEEEEFGLDHKEHGSHAYPELVKVIEGGAS